jgi:hypothetical protein
VANPTVNEMMEAYALDAVDFAREHFQYDLDYSVESVERVDQILERFHQELPRGLGSALRRGPSDCVGARRGAARAGVAIDHYGRGCVNGADSSWS